MKRVKKILKWFFILFGRIIVLTTLIVILFMKFSPQFGGKISEKQKESFEKLDHYDPLLMFFI